MSQPTIRPRITWFAPDTRQAIVDEAVGILGELGVFVENKEAYFPDPVIDRSTLEEWQKGGATSAADRAQAKVEKVLAGPGCEPLPADTKAELDAIMLAEARAAGLEKLISS